MRMSLVAGLLIVLPIVAQGQAKGTAVLSGVVIDTMRQPLTDVEVAFTDISLRATTNDKGAFKISGISSGLHRLSVRRIGFASLDTVLAFADGQSIDRRIILGVRVVQLDSVIALDSPRDPIMIDFETNKARGFGRFLDADQLAKMSVRPLGLAVQTMSGLEVLRGHANQGWITGKNAMPTHCPRSTGVSNPTHPNADPVAAAREMQAAVDQCLRRERIYYVPDPTEEAQGISRQCYALVYVDRHVMNPGRPTPPFNL